MESIFIIGTLTNVFFPVSLMINMAYWICLCHGEYDAASFMLYHDIYMIPRNHATLFTSFIHSHHGLDLIRCSACEMLPLQRNCSLFKCTRFVLFVHNDWTKFAMILDSSCSASRHFLKKIGLNRKAARAMNNSRFTYNSSFSTSLHRFSSAVCISAKSELLKLLLLVFRQRFFFSFFLVWFLRLRSVVFFRFLFFGKGLDSIGDWIITSKRVRYELDMESLITWIFQIKINSIVCTMWAFIFERCWGLFNQY